ncbi:MAG: tyrosine-type recombinase/integrase [Chloroflexi bacterium]|nr:tyrosine-type recombinase/integrase [Chloroflexota bacterium]
MSEIIPVPDDDIELVDGEEGVSGVLARLENRVLREAIDSWVRATTDHTSPRFDDLLRDKARPVVEFFAMIDTSPDRVTVDQVKAYHRKLEERGLAQATIYAMLSKISSFYRWLGDLPEFRGRLVNPVAAARPKAPKAYQSQSTKSLTDDEVRRMVKVLKARADSGDVVGIRDYAMFLTYILTGLRRTEVARLRWGDLDLSGVSARITYRAKGGDVLTREVDDRVAQAMVTYLRASGRINTMTADSPIWTSHDVANVRPGKQLTSHAFAKNLKKYARKAGLAHIHIHQTRHTYARIVADETGSIVETQDALGHANTTTTRVYVQRVGVKKDKHGASIAERLGL